MAQTTTGWRSIFSLPAVYRLAQRNIGNDGVRAAFVSNDLRPEPGDRVLDIGCGTADVLLLLGDVDYVGYDPSSEYIEAARERFGDSGTFHVSGVGEFEPTVGGFDVCLAKGVLHHLDDEAAHALFAQASSALRSGGRLVTMDPAFTPDQSPIAKFLASRDRGQNVRDADAYEALALAHFDDVDKTVRHDMLRVPYTHAILTCTK